MLNALWILADVPSKSHENNAALHWRLFKGGREGTIISHFPEQNSPSLLYLGLSRKVRSPQSFPKLVSLPLSPSCPDGLLSSSVLCVSSMAIVILPSLAGTTPARGEDWVHLDCVLLSFLFLVPVMLAVRVVRQIYWFLQHGCRSIFMLPGWSFVISMNNFVTFLCTYSNLLFQQSSNPDHKRNQLKLS